jgi:PAB-dependent poly(A)-specific ribonuclease subunit 2
VASFYGRDLQRYTAFKIHPPSEGPVRQFLFHDKGVICLGTRSVHMAMRRGPALWNIRYGCRLMLWREGKKDTEALTACWQT